MIKLDDLAFAAQAHPMERIIAVVLFVGLIALEFHRDEAEARRCE